MVCDMLVLSVITTVPVLEPAAIGLKLTDTEQLSPFLRVAGQFQLTPKSAAFAVSAIFRMVLPLLFVMVMVWLPLLVPASCLGNASEVAESVNGGVTPVPAKLTV